MKKQDEYLFENSEISMQLQKALKEQNITKMTQVQKEVIPALLKNEHILMQAPTGTGKTLAFLLPILQNIKKDQPFLQAIIITPTRELATQIYEVCQELNALTSLNYKVHLTVGGADRQKSLSSIANEQPQIIVGTPGRIKDIVIKEKIVNTTKLQYVVLDETDMIVENGFLEDIDELFSTLSDAVIYAVASATVSQEIEIFLKKYLPKGKHVKIKTDSGLLSHYLYPIRSMTRTIALQKMMDIIQPYMAIIFVNTKKQAAQLHEVLAEKYSAIGLLHGDMQARERKQMLRRIKQLEFQYVIASDIAARGIDIEGASHIINYELPNEHNLSFYFHRAGRTGRKAYYGEVYTLFAKEDLHIVQKLEQKGVAFQMIKIADGEIILSDEKLAQKVTFDEQLVRVSQRAKKKANKKNVVKPGYRKKIRRSVEQAIQKEKRAQKKAGRKK